MNPPQPHRPSTSCTRHPQDQFTGFCPSCLFDRLSTLNPQPPSLPELRRTKSFSATKNEALESSSFEPQRRSCDVRVRNTLSSLFNEEVVNVIKSPLFEEETGIGTDSDINIASLKEPRRLIDEERYKLDEIQEVMEKTTKKPNRSFWSAASKKLQKWRLKKKNRRSGDGSGVLPVEKSIGNQFRDTQSEIAEYGYGRRSCDTDPRFSIDAGRFSLDEPPRGSWDGLRPRMLSVVEDVPVPVEEVVVDVVPGGSEQTREYYTDSSSRRRKSLDRSSSTRKLSEIDEVKRSPLKAKDSVSHSNLVREDCLDVNVGTVECSKKGSKKSKRWSWNIFGLLHRKNGNKFEERSGVDQTWNVDTRKEFDPKMMRSSSTVSWRSSDNVGGGLRRNSVDGYVSGKKTGSSSNERQIDNGMLKFYLTPGKGRRRGSDNATTGTTNGAVSGSNLLGRNAMNIY